MENKFNWRSSHLSITGLKCDVSGCGYRDDSVAYSEYSSMIGRPCPLCGASLLTMADYKFCVWLTRITTAFDVISFPLHAVRWLLSDRYRKKQLSRIQIDTHL